MLESLDVELRAEGGATGILHVRCRPNQVQYHGEPLLLDRSEDHSGTDVVLLEEAEYRFELTLPSDSVVVGAQPQEIIDFDDHHRLRGRFRPGQYVGTLPVSVTCDDGRVFGCRLEVRSRKLDYDTDYRSMLASIARDSAELLMQRFGPSVLGAFSASAPTEPRTVYQRYAFLQSLLSDYAFDAAMAVVLARPHVQFDAELEVRDLSRGVRAGSSMNRQLARVEAARRTSGAGALRAAGSPKIIQERFEATLDTEPNRFLRMAFEHWRTTIDDVLTALQKAPAGAPIERGLIEASALRDRIDEILGRPPLRDVGRLTHFPLANQVLQKREGYREIFAAFFQSELAAQLDWEGGDAVFEAGRRDVATLYEFWCYLQLRHLLTSLCDDFEDEPLFEPSDDGMSLVLKQGRECVLTGHARRHGRDISIELWFNRFFSAGKSGESWTRSMRPDCSVRIAVDKALSASSSDFWLHFDAKYKVEHLKEFMAVDEDPTADAEPARAAKRADLLKMHAYRDAIKRSAGAYVLYPGDDPAGERGPMYAEILPGLGAFPLRVGSDGNADSSSVASLRAFLNEVIEHAANQASQHERARLWLGRSFSLTPLFEARAEGFLEDPPADTRVLLGFVRGEEHQRWIEKTRLYNLRADDRTGAVTTHSPALSARLVVLYGDGISATAWTVDGAPRVVDREMLVALGYPGPRGTVYFCLPLGQTVKFDAEAALDERVAMVLGTRAEPIVGAPIDVSWAELAGATVAPTTQPDRGGSTGTG